MYKTYRSRGKVTVHIVAFGAALKCLRFIGRFVMPIESSDMIVLPGRNRKHWNVISMCQTLHEALSAVEYHNISFLNKKLNGVELKVTCVCRPMVVLHSENSWPKTNLGHIGTCEGLRALSSGPCGVATSLLMTWPASGGTSEADEPSFRLCR